MRALPDLPVAIGAFDGGVGENSARVRSAAAGSVAFLGIKLDPRLNDEDKGDGLLSALGAAVPVVLIQTAAVERAPFGSG